MVSQRRNFWLTVIIGKPKKIIGLPVVKVSQNSIFDWLVVTVSQNAIFGWPVVRVSQILIFGLPVVMVSQKVHLWLTVCYGKLKFNLRLPVIMVSLVFQLLRSAQNLIFGLSLYYTHLKFHLWPTHLLWQTKVSFLAHFWLLSAKLTSLDYGQTKSNLWLNACYGQHKVSSLLSQVIIELWMGWIEFVLHCNSWLAETCFRVPSCFFR